MITDIDQIVSSGRYGMPRKHMELLTTVATQTNNVFGIRGVNIFAHHYLDKGYPTKPFCIKNKSSNQGPMAGLIAINPLYSRENTEAGFAKHKKLLEIAHEKDLDQNLVNAALTLTPERINELKLLFGHSNTIIEDPSDNKPYYTFIWKKGSQTLKVKGVKHHTGTYSIVDENDQPIEVLGRKIDGEMLPITADYDLFVVCPRKEELDLAFFDKNPFWTQGKSVERIQKQVKESEDNAKLPLEKRNPRLPQEHPHAGNWSPRVERLSKYVNEKLCHKVMHHNEEQKSPFADDLTASLPCLFIFPKSLMLSTKKGKVRTKIALVESVAEMITLRNMVQGSGFYWPPHAKYKDHFKSFTSRMTKAVDKAVQSMEFRSKIDKTISDWEMACSNFGQQNASVSRFSRKT